MPLLPVKLQRHLVARSKDLLVLSNRSRLLRFCAMWVYKLMQLVITQRLASVPGVRSVYLCHGLAAGECYPGLSDFDLVVVFHSSDPLSFYDHLRARWGSLRRYVPVNDLSLITTGEFNEWQHIGGGWDPLDEVQHWKLLAGDELRRTDLPNTEESAAMDRMSSALGHFHNLLTIAVKEEQKSRFMAIIARRQLHKCFWNTVLKLEPGYFGFKAQYERIAQWIKNRGAPAPVADLQAMYDRQFLEGPVSVLRFSAAALAYRLLDESLQTHPLVARPIRRPQCSDKASPIRNHVEAEERALAMSTSIRELMEEKISSIMLGSTGSARGYALYVVLRDGLSEQEVADGLRDIRAIHRVNDDLWYNEHLPGGVPTVCSRAMFLARLQTGRSSLHYFESFRLVLFGADLYEEAVAIPVTSPETDPQSERTNDWRREWLVYSMHLHRVYLGLLKPALYEYVTFYLPRLMLQRQTGTSPATAEEAVLQYAGLPAAEQQELPRYTFDQYHSKDLDFLLGNMDLDAFRSAWPLLRQGLLTRDELA